MNQEISLIKLKLEEKGIIQSVMGGWRAKKRLADLGLTPGTEIKALNKAPFWGPVEIEVKGSKLVLGRGIASKVLVKKV
jgi:Fe2+ transport system protein FeoA